jgi:hypothetical protein
MKTIIVLALIIAAVWFVASVQHQDNGSVQALTGNGSRAEMREIDTAAGKLKLVVKPDTTTSLDPDMQIVRQNFTLERFSWRKEAFDTIMIADFTFNNKNSFDIKDVDVKCDDSAESGTIIDTNDRVIYQLFRGNSKHTVDGFNMGFIHSQAKSSGCSIVDFRIVPGTDRPKPATTTAKNSGR